MSEPPLAGSQGIVRLAPTAWEPARPVEKRYRAEEIHRRSRPGELTLEHLARHLRPTLAEQRQVAARQTHGRIPAEDRITLTAEEQRRWFPPGPGRVGEEWELDPGVTRKVLNHVRPPSHTFTSLEEDVLEASLRARVVRLEGWRAQARLLGFAVCQLTGGGGGGGGVRVEELQLVTRGGTWITPDGSLRMPFGSFFRMVPARERG